jgi:competence protein ComEC
MSTALLRWYPHLLAGALCAGLAAANLVRMAAAAVAVAAGAAALVAVVLRPAWRIPAFACALLLAGWWWGSARLETLDRSVLLPFAGESARTVAVVTGPPRRGGFTLRIPAEVRRFGRLDVVEPVLLMLPLGRAPPQGAVLELIGRVERPRSSDEGFDEATWLRRRGVSVVVDGSHWHAIGRRGGLGGVADRLRSHLEKTIAPGQGGERRAVVAGVVLGADEGLSAELRDSFRASGLYHLLAVSGQNIAFIAAGVLGAAWIAGVPRWLGELGVLAAIGGYVLAVGWQPSVVRAGVAGALASLAWLAARPRERWYVLLLGAAVLLVWNPYALLEPGFQLSFAAVGAIFVVVPRVRRRLEGYPVPRFAATAVGVSAACGAVTAPIVWVHFGAVPTYTVIANALAAPVVAPLLGLGLLAAALHPVLPAAAFALAWANGWLAAYLATCARLVGSLPGAQVTSGQALAGIAVLAALLLAAMRLHERARRRLLAVAAVAVALAGAWMLAPESRPALPVGVRITVLDVGQGDGILIQTRRAAVLVDEGPPEAEVAAQLERLGVRRISLLVLTHPQRDHVGGAADVLERLPVDAVLDPRIPADSPEEHAALAAARERRVPVLTARAGAVYRLGRLRIEVLWPDGPGAPGEDPNEHATVLLVSYGDLDALLTADAEANVTARLRPPPVEILKVAHHGSADPLLPALLRRLRPQVAVISVGEDNEYGHPAPSTLAALTGVRLYRTDEDGPVRIESDGTALRIRTDR